MKRAPADLPHTAAAAIRPATDRRRQAPYWGGALLVVGVLTALRVALLFVSDHNLAPDEAQYWSWSQEPAFGYFSKPPMIAWLIAATTHLFGNTEAAIRLASPLLHGATALVLFHVARGVANDRVAFWSAALYATGPAVWFSSGLISTDVPLLFFWTVALLAMWRLLMRQSVGWALLLGAAMGLGMLSKYAMIYFVLGAVLFLMVSLGARRSRTAVLFGLALAVAAVIFAPNVLWNMQHGMSTVTHTAANANWGAERFNVDKLLEFVGAQFGVFGPLLFLALLIRVATLRRADLTQATRFLLCFSLPPLVIVAVEAFISRANANWAVAAYSAATVLVASFVLERTIRLRWIAPASVALHTLAGTVLAVLILAPSVAGLVGLSNAFKRVRGWDLLADRIVRVAAEHEPAQHPFTAVLTNDRLVHGELLFYGRGRLPPLAMWDYDGVPENHFEMTAPLTDALGKRVLFVANYEQEAHDLVNKHFAHVEALGPVSVPIGGGRTRTLTLYALDDFQGRE